MEIYSAVVTGQTRGRRFESHTRCVTNLKISLLLFPFIVNGTLYKYTETQF